MANEQRPLPAVETSDKDHLLNIFSLKLWKRILEEVKDPADLTNVSNASPFFHEILSPKRMDFLFPEVWSALAFAHDSDGFQQPPTIKEKGIHERQRALLPLRTVSRWWKESIDNAYKSQALLNVYAGPDWTDSSDISLATENFQFLPSNKSNSVSEFLQHFEPAHGNEPGKNPFLAGKLNLTIPDTSDVEQDRVGREEYINHITTLLTKYGRHIHICHLYLANHGSCEKVEFYVEICRWLRLMPNLISLHILYNNNSLNAKENKRLVLGIVSNPLWKLPHLRNLTMANLPPDFFNCLVSAQSHISTLEVHAGGHRPEYDLYTVPFEKLRRLYIFYDESYNLIEKLDTVKFKLNTLKLRAEIPAIYLHRMFQVLGNKFGSCLNHFKLIIILPHLRSLALPWLDKAAYAKYNGAIGDQDENSNYSVDVDSDDETGVDSGIWDEGMARTCRRLQNKLLPNVSIFELKFELK